MELNEGQKFMIEETRKLVSEEYKKSVIIKFNNSRRQAGICQKRIGIHIIKYSNRHIEDLQKEDLLKLIIHEVSHIPFPNHKQDFKNECIRIGNKYGINYKEDYLTHLSLNQYNYIYKCNMCGFKMGRVRPFKGRRLHPKCCNKLRAEKAISLIDARFISI